MNNAPCSLLERAMSRAQWKVSKFHDTADFEASNQPDEEITVDLNILLDEGVTILQALLTGGAGTDFGNANAFLGIGDAGAPTVLTGTITFTNGSSAVSAVGGAFLTDVVVGDIIRLDADDAWVEVRSITDDNNLVLGNAAGAVNYVAPGGTGAASGLAKAVATESGLQGSSTAYVAMDATYPQIAGQTTTWRASFGDGVAVFPWREATVANGNSNAADNLNRKVMGLGTKGATGTWVLELQITWG